MAKESTLYYFYSVGCGWCKKTEPLIDELNESGDYEILKLDLAEKDNQELNKQLKEKYGKQCGTPWLIDAESGNHICGHREKDIIEKWAKGEEIPEPPKPKSPPPPPPQDFDNEEQVKTWREGYEKWVKENDHMPNLPKADDMLNRLKQQKKLMEQRQAQQAQQNGNLEARMSVMEQKLDRLLNHLGVKTNDIKPPVQKPTVVNNPPRQVPAPPANSKPPKKKKNKKGKK
jgi:glutaredoxin